VFGHAAAPRRQERAANYWRSSRRCGLASDAGLLDRKRREDEGNLAGRDLQVLTDGPVSGDRETGHSCDSYDWFFLAMSCWKLGQKDTAREWYVRAVEWMEKNQPHNHELNRFRAEAAELLGIKAEKN
jgi:hypothetical protein